MAMPKARTVPQSAREYPRTFGRHRTSSTSAAAASRSVTTPAAPAPGMILTARAAPNCTEMPAAMTSATGPKRDGATPAAVGPTGAVVSSAGAGTARSDLGEVAGINPD